MSLRFSPSVTRNSHLANLTAFFGEVAPRQAPPPPPPDVKYVFVCYTNRCGSHYFAELLASNGNYNRADENLNWDTVKNHAVKQGFKSFQDYFHWLVSTYQKAGRFFIKVAVAHLELLYRAGILDLIADRSQFLLIERGDKLAQAISHALAFGTGRFTSISAGSLTPEEIMFSRLHIDYIVEEIAEFQKQFDLFFARNGFVPTKIVYEHLVADPAAQIKYAGEQLGLADLWIDPSKLRLEPQAGPVNERWRQSYLNGADA